MVVWSTHTVFECRMCGHCCEGSGGIVVSPADVGRPFRVSETRAR